MQVKKNYGIFIYCVAGCTLFGLYIQKLRKEETIQEKGIISFTDKRGRQHIPLPLATTPNCKYLVHYF